MPMITLTCPHCGFSKERSASTLPPAGTRATCPRCKGVFTLGDGPGPGVRPESGQASPSGVSVTRRTLTFTFTGNAQEYFGIWIVNTLLRIVTLGIYSPWAKVRKRRYFYGNTLLDDAPFDYLADPVAILKGWFIAGAFFGLYSLSSQFSPILASVLMLVFFAVFPWVVVRSRSFNLRNSSHRNIRFGFNSDYGEAYRVFLWWQLAIPFTLGILAPYVVFRQKQFLVENASYGTTRFTFHATAKEYYRIFLPLFVLIPLLVGSIAGMAFLAPKGGGNPALAAIPVICFVLVYALVLIYVPTALTNLTWNATGIGSHRFACALRVRDLAWIYFSNGVAIVCTLGMLAPWAAVRLARYRLDRLTATGVGDLGSITAAAGQTVGATGEELGDMLGFDLGL